jgi:hypothetical protein
MSWCRGRRASDARNRLSSPDRSSRCSSDETLVQLRAAVNLTFDSDPGGAKACLQRAAELLQVSGNREGHRRNESPRDRRIPREQDSPPT